MKHGTPRILIIRLSAIGDVVRVLPALHNLRDAFPNAQIDWAVEPKAADIISGHPAIDDLLVFERPEGAWPAFKAFMRFCMDVRTRHYEVIADFHGIFKSGLITAFSKADDKYGFARPRSQELSYLFTNRKVRLSSEKLNRVEENLALCERIAPARSRPNVTMFIPADVQDDIHEYYDHTFDGGKLTIAVHVPVDREEKRWPDAHFAALCDMLLGDGRYEVVLTWGPGQLGEVEAVMRKMRRKPRIAPEMPGLKHYACFVHSANLYFGCDTGPMHIAAIMGTPVVAVFGGTDPAKHAPVNTPCRVLYAEPGKTNGELPPAERLEMITPEMAYDACVDLLAKTKD